MEVLKAAEKRSQIAKKFRSITFNNLACIYKRIGKLRSAQKYLEQAISTEMKSASSDTTADTYLNLCAVLSQLGKHESALENITMAIFLLQDQMVQLKLNAFAEQQSNENQDQNQNPEANKKKDSENLPNENKEEDNENQNEDSNANLNENQNQNLNQNQNQNQPVSSDNPSPSLSEDRLSVLAMAHYNMAVELEHLNRLEEAIKVYEKACSFIETHLPSNAMLASSCQEAYTEANEKLEKREKANKQKKREKDSLTKDRSTQSIKKKGITTKLKPSSNRMYSTSN